MIIDDFENEVAARNWQREHVGHRDLSPGQMAARLGVTVETVEAYLRSLGHRWHCKKEPKFPPEVFAAVKRRFAK